jgi:hypothetical protein
MMIEIDGRVVSLDLLEKHFICDLDKCKGMCCVHGDSGAPLEPEEAVKLDKLFPAIKKYLRPEGIQAIKNQGRHVIDNDGDVVTPLVDGKECAYVIFEQGIAKCGIEKAFEDGAIDYQKPVSCHLYPVRTKRYQDFEGVNYDRWEICKPATLLGQKENIPVYKFVKKALIRKYGSGFYKKLEIAADSLVTSKEKK